MEDTCTTECAWYKKYFKRGRMTCPFYLETLWSNDEGTPKTVKDCAPKRSVLLTMEMSNRMIGVQKSAEQERNLQHKMVDKLIQIQRQYSLVPDAEYKLLD